MDVVYIDLQAALNSIDQAALLKSLSHHIMCAHRGRVLPNRLDYVQGAPGLCAAPDLLCRAIDWLIK